jgi:hypothetical protein
MNDATNPLDSPHFTLPPTGPAPQMQQPMGEMPASADAVTPDDAAMLRRIQACVNACDGISTQELEEGVVQDMQRVLRDVAPIMAEWSSEQKQQMPQMPQPITRG